MHSVFIGLGSNLGIRRKNIRRALNFLENEGAKLVACSSFYRTAPQGFKSSHYFVNAAAHMMTPLTPQDFLATTQRAEQSLGRTNKSHDGVYSDRIIDIDILFFDNEVVETPALVIPHPLISQRTFVLEPLCEIAPDLIDPQNGLTVRTMLEALCFASETRAFVPENHGSTLR